MNTHQLREAQALFLPRMEAVIEQRETLHRYRTAFIKHFSLQRISKMKVEEYVIGLTGSQEGYNFCYGIERELDGLGRILGATSHKFGIYYGQTKSDREMKYRFTKKFGNNQHQAFENVRETLIRLLVAGERNDIEEIRSNALSPMFKGKILATYFPEKFLTVFSSEHLNYFLTQLDLDLKNPKLLLRDDFTKRQALIDLRDSDEIMQNWSADIFSYFLYNYYPGRPPKDGQEFDDPLADYRPPVFPSDPSPNLIELDILDPVSPHPSRMGRGGRTNPDYEGEARKQKLLGTRGENIVIEEERKRLRAAGKYELATAVDRARFDYEGYDIKSFEIDGTPRYIEVKTTRADVGKVNFFLSANELQKAMLLENYHVYVVFGILDKSPQIWRAGNLFKPDDTRIVKTPVSYRVTINTQRR